MNGKQEGKAKFTNTKGQTRMGLWENGQRKKWLNKDGQTERTSQYGVSQGFPMSSMAGSDSGIGGGNQGGNFSKNINR